MLPAPVVFDAAHDPSDAVDLVLHQLRQGNPENAVMAAFIQPQVTSHPTHGRLVQMIMAVLTDQTDTLTDDIDGIDLDPAIRNAYIAALRECSQTDPDHADHWNNLATILTPS